MALASFARMTLQAPRQRRAALAACCMAARRIVGRPGRRWRTSQRAQHAPGVRKRRRACPAAGKSPLVWAPGLLWWAAAPTGLWAHHDGSVSEGGRRQIRAPIARSPSSDGPQDPSLESM